MMRLPPYTSRSWPYTGAATVAATRYATTTHDTRSTPPRLAAMAGSAVATMVESTTARNMGSMTEVKTVRNRRAVGGACGTSARFCSSSFMPVPRLIGRL